VTSGDAVSSRIRQDLIKVLYQHTMHVINFLLRVKYFSWRFIGIIYSVNIIVPQFILITCFFVLFYYVKKNYTTYIFIFYLSCIKITGKINKNKICKMWVRITLMARCTQYNIMWSRLSVTYTPVFCKYHCNPIFFNYLFFCIVLLCQKNLYNLYFYI
jgi:hypothetical protein